MKITFILPAIGKKKNKKYIGTWKMEPLSIAVLNSLTPEEHKTELFDDRIEDINYETETDIVAISVETYTAKRSYLIAEKFKKRNITVVMGGYHTTLFPDEVLEHCDSIVIGNAENVWVKLLEDYQNGKLKDKYYGEVSFSDKIPDRSIFKGKKYLPLTLIETGRGCNHKCEFCAITAYYNAKYSYKKIEKIIEEIKTAKNQFIFFVDDNISANQEFAIKLFKEIAKLKIQWAGQATLGIANNPELLYWMKKSGCAVILIGFESLDDKNLKQMSKEWSAKLGKQEGLVKKIHKAGISIYATFVFGFDNDTEQSISSALNFSKKSSFFMTAFNHLLPFPGTALYERFENENKFIKKEWWLDKDYSYGQISFSPEKISPEKLSYECLVARKKFFSFLSIFKRGIVLLSRKPSLLIYINFWIQNFVLSREVSEKFGLPIGDRLDEKIK